MLAELLRQIGETTHAIVALEHAHALRPLRDVDVMMLAELYVAEGAPGQAAAHLRRIAAGSESFGRAQELLGVLALGKGDHKGARSYLERSGLTAHQKNGPGGPEVDGTAPSAGPSSPTAERTCTSWPRAASSRSMSNAKRLLPGAKKSWTCRILIAGPPTSLPTSQNLKLQ